MQVSMVRVRRAWFCDGISVSNVTTSCRFWRVGNSDEAASPPDVVVMFLRLTKLRARGLGVSERSSSEGITAGSLED